MKVPLLDISEQYDSIRDEAIEAITKVCDSKRFVLGENVEKLEEEVAAYTGAKYAVGCASGSDALMLALMALGVGPGDRVITSPFTFFATAGAIARLGALPVFVDIDPRTFNMDPGKLERRLAKSTAKIKAVIPVHLYGQCAPMMEINSILKKYDIPSIEDAAQSIGASYGARKAGSLGELGCLSFYPSKNLGCFGDGGMVTTNKAKLADSVKKLRVHGGHKRYYHDEVGVNSRLDEIQAAVLRVKLKRLPKWEDARIKNALIYRRYFENAGLDKVIKLPYIAKSNKSVFNQYVIRSENRDQLRAFLATKDIGSEIYYPIPLHMQKCFSYLGYKMGSFPNAESAAWEVLALPMYPELTEDHISYVVEKVGEFFKK